MKYLCTFLIFAVLLTDILPITGLLRKDSIFYKTFKDLHGEPQAPLPRSRANIEINWIEQKLDHFNANDERNWQMRYMSNNEFYQSGGPLFIMVGGEWKISDSFIKGGHLYDLAKEHNGYLVYTEHRYYGESRPTNDTSNENLKYLNVRQALADLAHFITEIKLKTDGMLNSKVILTGGSYSATMVTWFKKEYPDLVAGCWASSAPLFAKANFIEYKEVTGDSIRLLGTEACYNRIENGIAELEKMFANKRGAEVKAMLQLCNSFDETNDLDIWTLFSEISDIFAVVVQTHNAGSIEKVCNTILDGKDDVSGLTAFILSKGSINQCNVVSYKAVLDYFDDITNNNMMRQKLYQTCNEFGWYQTSGSIAQPFGTKFPLVYYTTMCADVYGSQYTNSYIQLKISETNNFFGGLTPNVTNVYMTHGQLDPWRAMGIQDEQQATIIPLYAHCKDLDSISDEDTANMRASKLKIAQLVREWVGAERI